MGFASPRLKPYSPTLSCVVEGLKEHFRKFGDVKECMVMRDPVTKRSRGFGFVTFVDQTGVDKVLAQPRHELDSKTVS
ncbi:MSI1H protein, partial [Polyodon spathula]|nr:MSI1H protein [Polyodon spathula]